MNPDGGPAEHEAQRPDRRSNEDIGRRLPATRVMLVGMMGSGKTSVGTVLARRTGWPFLDNDALVERVTGTSARDLLRNRGERALRDAEAEALAAGLRIAPPVIVDVAGGVVTRAEDRARLRRAGFVVWLRAGIPTLVQRVGRGEDRPWLGGDPESALRALYRGREAQYREVATTVIDVDDLTSEQVADRIIEALRSRPAS